MGNFALPLPPADRKTGEGRRMAAALGRRPWGLGGGRGWGKRGREARGFHSPSQLGPGWSVEGWPRGPAAAALGGSSGGAREPGRRSAGAA